MMWQQQAGVIEHKLVVFCFRPAAPRVRMLSQGCKPKKKNGAEENRLHPSLIYFVPEAQPPWEENMVAALHGHLTKSLGFGADSEGNRLLLRGPPTIPELSQPSLGLDPANI